MQTEEINMQKNNTIKCSSCGNELPSDAKFCLECRTKVEPPTKENEIKCPKCGAIVPEGKFCLECGAKLENNCSNCGAALIPGAKFCLECGNKIEG